MPNAKPKPLPLPGEFFIPHFPAVKKAKPKGDPCPVCGRTHDHAGAYLCFACGDITCSRNGAGICTADLLAHHDRIDGFTGKNKTCGPAIRISYSPNTVVRIRKHR